MAAKKAKKVAKKKAKRTRKPRDYKAEYQRRIQRAELMGESRDVARGHPKKGEIGLRERRQMEKVARIQAESDGGPTDSFLRKRLAERIAELAETEVNVKLDKNDKDVWIQRKRDVEDGAADAFLAMYMDLGLGSMHEAYSLWFSP